MTLKERFDFKPLLDFKKNWMQIIGLIFFLVILIIGFFDHPAASLMAVGFYVFIARSLLRQIKVWK